MNGTNQSNRAAKIKAALAGRSPRQVGQEKALTILHWIYKWGWTSPRIVDLLCNDTKLVNKLVKKGWILKTRTESGGAERDVPAFILTLTKNGIIEVERHLHKEEDLLPSDTNPLKIKQALLRHDHLGQYITATSLLKGNISDFLTPLMMNRKSESGIKQPDVVWVNNGKKYAIEVELTGKWKRDLNMFVMAVLRALLPTKGGEIIYAGCFILSDSEAILARYKTAFRHGSVHDSWQKNTTRHWVKNGTFTIPKGIEEKLAWRKIDYK